MTGETNARTATLAAAVEPKAALRRVWTHSEPMAGPRVMVSPVPRSVNHPSGNRVGSRLKLANARPSCHHPRARRWSAATEETEGGGEGVVSVVSRGILSSVQPAEGPAPTPSPHLRRDQINSATPWAAALHDPSLRSAPAKMASPPSRRLRPSLGPALQTSPLP